MDHELGLLGSVQAKKWISITGINMDHRKMSTVRIGKNKMENIKMENILQKFSYISVLSKPTW